VVARHPYGNWKYRMSGSAMIIGQETDGSTSGWRVDKVGALLSLLIVVALFVLPFLQFRANRIVLGEGIGLLAALPGLTGSAFLVFQLVIAAIALLSGSRRLRLAAGLVGLVVLGLAVGVAASSQIEPGDTIARVSPGSGFWLLFGALALLVADVLSRRKTPPALRVALVGLACLGLALFLGSGLWDDLSVMREYQNRAQAFWREGARHLVLAFGSLAAAAVAGIPLGILCHQVKALRGPVLGVLNILQTVPSIALFGLLIAPLSWLSTSVPALRSLGISGIGAAPAFIALFVYSLLPIVANTVAGLSGVPQAVSEAARGMGMTRSQRLLSVSLPLAFPVILTGIRIVLVQNIGLATIAALIGGGGFGVFVFQGVGQTAMDLVLLGALPTVLLAFASAVVLDAAVDALKPQPSMETGR
jgi:osmoprotectant transport system permease protein